MTMPDEMPCTCGHMRDEHYRSEKCTIDECSCICFEPDADFRDEDDEAMQVKRFGLP